MISAKMKPFLAILRYIQIVIRACHYRSFLITLCVVLPPSLCSATIIVAIQDGESVWVGTDSLLIGSDGVKFICKIQTGQDFYWAVATPLFIDENTGFDFRKMVQQINPEGGPTNALSAFIIKSKSPIAKEIIAVRGNNPKSFAYFLTFKQMFQVVFFGTENGQPDFVWGALKTNQTDGVVNIIGDGPNSLTAKVGVISTGVNTTAQPYLAAHFGEAVQDPEEFIRTSIALQESATPRLDFGPISIARVSPKGFTWIEKGECQ